MSHEPLRPSDLGTYYEPASCGEGDRYAVRATARSTAREADTDRAQLCEALRVVERARAILANVERGKNAAATGRAYDLYFVLGQAVALILEPDDTRRATLPGAAWLPKKETP